MSEVFSEVFMAIFAILLFLFVKAVFVLGPIILGCWLGWYIAKEDN